MNSPICAYFPPYTGSVFIIFKMTVRHRRRKKTTSDHEVSISWNKTHEFIDIRCSSELSFNSNAPFSNYFSKCFSYLFRDS